MPPPDAPRDRLVALLAQNPATLNGIDFVEVADDAQTTLNVHFLRPSPDLTGTIPATAVTIRGGETIPTVAVQSASPVVVAGKALLQLKVAAPGDFSFYTLKLADSRLDPFFDHAPFTFKARCPSTIDCQPPPVSCPEPEPDRLVIDYLAKDFDSFRRALSDFSARRYPGWAERSEADFGVMLLEALSAVADDLSYTQDRIAAEAALPTATQRRSIVRHGRTVDYEPRPATASRVLLQFDVTSGPIPSGLVVNAQGPDGRNIPFETGCGLVDPTTGALDLTNFPASPTWNRSRADGSPNLKPYFWDQSESCLKAGSTEAWIAGVGFGLAPGLPLLIDTAGTTPADPPKREVVRLIDAVETTDPLFNAPVTKLRWRPDDALTLDHDLTDDPLLSAQMGQPIPRTMFAGNLVPATQGRRFSETFAIVTSPATAPDAPLALVRSGPRPKPDSGGCACGDGGEDPACAPAPSMFLHPLTRDPLAWLAPLDGGPDEAPLPEIYVVQDTGQPGDLLTRWVWRRSLLEADADESAFTIDPMRYSVTLDRGPGQAPVLDYDGDDGSTLRFGDDAFGRRPEEGTLFRILYRAGGSAIGNVAADTITGIDASALGGPAQAVTNPFPAEGGADAEPNDRVRELAPFAFRARQFRAIRPEDYNAQTERLPWVQRAGTAFRWTGSWLTVFNSADPIGAVGLTTAQSLELVQLLNRVRMAGYEAYAPTPRYAPLDIQLFVCAKADAFRSEVRTALLQALGPGVLPGDRKGFFHPDHFTFGDPLELSALEAAAQAVPGVAGVIEVRFRRRGHTLGYVPMPLEVQVGAGMVILVENDPNRPDRGSIRVYVEGGR